MGFEWDRVEPQFSQIYSVTAADDDNITSFAGWMFIILLRLVAFNLYIKSWIFTNCIFETIQAGRHGWNF
jgi:hypothetical protein